MRRFILVRFQSGVIHGNELFWRKDPNEPRLGSEHAVGDGPKELVTHRLTMELTRAESLAVMLANSRAAAVMEVSDLLAGMYIYSWERLSKYWNADHREQVESLLQQICQISPQRWNYWIQLYDKKRREGEKQRGWLPAWKPTKPQPEGKPLNHSAALTLLLKQAEEIAPSHDSIDGRDLPILTSECVLLCIVRASQSEISRKLASSGLDVPKLEKDALSSRRAARD